MSRKKQAYWAFIKAAILAFKWPLLPMMKFMAETGFQTDEAYVRGFLPVSTHFYQPIPDLGDITSRNIWASVRPLPGAVNASDLIDEYVNVTSNYANECRWPIRQTGSNGKSRFFVDNGTFTFGCASALHCYVRHLKPRRIIEIGSGNSSKVINEALSLNVRDGAKKAAYVIVDPYCGFAGDDLDFCTDIIKDRVESLPLSFFSSLSANDILFIDSSHASKAGSDVNFLILEVLPTLPKNVYIHFHDIPMPFEYNRKYFTESDFRVFWNESYLLEAFLKFNSQFEIVMPMAFLQAFHMSILLDLFPQARGLPFGFESGSMWIRRAADNLGRGGVRIDD